MERDPADFPFALVMHAGLVPERWRERTIPAAVLLLTPSEREEMLAGEPPQPALSVEDRRLAAMVVAGTTLETMAKRLAISPRTLQRRLRRLREVFGVSSTQELAAALGRAGF